MQTDLATLKELVREAIENSPVGQQLGDIALESDRGDDGTDFLRVIIQIKSYGKGDYPALLALIRTIENAVGAVDERYPSVRFAEAA